MAKGMADNVNICQKKGTKSYIIYLQTQVGILKDFACQSTSRTTKSAVQFARYRHMCTTMKNLKGYRKHTTKQIAPDAINLP